MNDHLWEALDLLCACKRVPCCKRGSRGKTDEKMSVVSRVILDRLWWRVSASGKMLHVISPIPTFFYLSTAILCVKKVLFLAINVLRSLYAWKFRHSTLKTLFYPLALSTISPLFLGSRKRKWENVRRNFLTADFFFT